MAHQIPLAATSGLPKRYYLTQGYWSKHLALDMVGQLNQPVLAAESGRVFSSSWDGGGWAIGGGNVVIIDHYGPGGKRSKTSYAHLSRRAVVTGQYVLKGQVIGWADSTGNSTGHHLHYSVGIADKGPANLYYSYSWRDPRSFLPAHTYQNGSQAKGANAASLYVHNTVIAKPGSNIRKGPYLSSPILRTTTTKERTVYLDTVPGSYVSYLGSKMWDKLSHPKVGIGYLHTNLGEWDL
jgi:murein DD-endopeptidase MepM/ murein hydrolase activator NlpD